MAHAPIVLVVEDEPSVQTTYCATLTLMGFKTLHADTVDRARDSQQRTCGCGITRRSSSRSERARAIRADSPRLSRASQQHAHVPVVIFTGVRVIARRRKPIQKHNAEVFYVPQRYTTLVECLTRMVGA